MPEKVVISAPSHVHIGNPDLNGMYGRLYGTLGFTLSNPRVVIEARKGNGCTCSRRDAHVLYEKLSNHYRCKLSIKISEEIPKHVGLGSTTSLYLSMAQAFDIICNDGRMNPLDLAKLTGRGKISALGVYGYIHGGFIVDGGFRIGGNEIPPLIYRAHVPSRYVMIVSIIGKHVERIRNLKKKEDEILRNLPKMDPEVADKASRIVLMGILPYVAEGDWQNAGKNITLFNRFLGEYWAREQKGVYCCKEAEDLIELHLDYGALLAGQSSWGPTIYALYDTYSHNVEEVFEHVRSFIKTRGGGQVWHTTIDNYGARIKIW